MKRLALGLILVLATTGGAGAAPGIFDGRWHGRLLTQDSADCAASYDMSVAIEGGRFRGFVVRGESRFAVSGTVEADGALADLRAAGRFDMVFRGRAAGERMTGQWHGGQSCDGSFALSRKRRSVRAAALQPRQDVAVLPVSTDARGSSGPAVVDLVMTHGIKGREPLDDAWSFSPGEARAFAFARIANPGAPSRVSFVWIYRDAIHATIELEIGASPNWRTWSSIKPLPGAWRVRVVTQDDAVLAERAFVVE